LGTTKVEKVDLQCLNLRMVNKANQIETEDKYGYIKPAEIEQSRLDLNVLLKRAKEEKKNDLKTNTIILSGAFALVLIVFVVLSL